ncbi:hypothetical protein ADL22_08615 [Streptomyces sp. NRRL F-4489]|uniref:hypothetical protein n=1 Tax=Streptomyces sp. NRRL F-4489 TaxID=1609095 RepID=UPI0007461939|nr:hypothetical protein [Streptomyces sp. NRRL F-4489]KUL49123.1 hypothetical protein ADL22_08615 [Streptomyces sp. NRRL F-4489]
MPNHGTPVPAPWPAPPQPWPGCAHCAELDARRAVARDEYDRSGETDCNILLRRHVREVHS